MSNHIAIAVNTVVGTVYLRVITRLLYILLFFVFCLVVALDFRLIAKFSWLVRLLSPLYYI